MKWENAELSLIAEIGDGAHASLKRVKSGIPYLTAKNITKNGISYSNIDFISEETYEKYFKEKSNALTKPQKNDILYSIIGSIGGVYCVKDEKIGISSSVAIIRANSELIFPQYLAYFLKSKFFEAQVQAIKGGVAQGFMSIEKLKNVNILYPKNLDYQAKIVSILSAYDDLIENNQKQIKLLEEAAQRLYKEWFVDLHFPGYKTTPIIDGVPEGWEKKKLVKVFDYVRGKSYSSKEIVENGKTLLINLKNIRAFGGYNRNAEKCYIGKYSDSQKLQAGDIVMGVTDMTQERRLVGHVAVVPDLGKDMIFSMDLIKLIPLTVEKSFLYSVMFYGGYSKQIAVLANGTNVLHLKPESMMSMEMLVPSNEIMSKYDDKFKNFYKKIELLENQNTILAEARDRLLPKLMSGELEV